MSTHRMNEVEELCNRIFMVNKGRGVLYGGLADIKARYRGNSVLLECEGGLPRLEGVTGTRQRENATELLLDGEVSPQQVLAQLVSLGIKVNRFEVSTPPLHDIFLRVVSESR
jgi:ABC-2 type transport system ATP-binding protein